MTLPATARLGEHVSFLSGFAFKSAFFNTEGEGLPIVRIRDVKAGRSDTYYSGEYDPKFIVSDGDYSIGMDGEFSLARWRGGKALLNQRVCKVESVSDRLDAGYLVRFLPSALKAIEDATPFVTVKHLSVKALRDIEIPCLRSPSSAVSPRFSTRWMLCARAVARPPPSSPTWPAPFSSTCSAARPTSWRIGLPGRWVMPWIS